MIHGSDLATLITNTQVVVRFTSITRASRKRSLIFNDKRKALSWIHDDA